MTVDGQDAVGVFRDDMSSFVEAEHAHDIAVLPAADKDLRFIDPARKRFPDFIGKLHPDPEINLVVKAADPVAVTPGFKHAVADAPYRKDDDRSRNGFFPVLPCEGDNMLVALNIFHNRFGQHFRMRLDRFDQLQHRLIVGIGAEVLHPSLLHVQIMLEAEQLELIIRFIALFPRSVFLKDSVRLKDVIHDLFFLDKLRQPAAVFGGDVVFAVGKRAGSGHALHDRAGITPQAMVCLAGDDRTAPFVQRFSLFQKHYLLFRTCFIQTVRTH